MFWVGKDEEGGAGDLALNWKLIGRGDAEEVMDAFYRDEMFLDELKDILVQNGFSQEAAYDVMTSESGMQDIGRASYDAYGIADEVREIGEKMSQVRF